MPTKSFNVWIFGAKTVVIAVFCAAALATGAMAAAPLYVYVPEFGGMIASYGRLGADVDASPQGGLIVTSVVPQTPAAKMDLRVGDHIRTIDGQQILDLDDAIQVLNAKGVSDTAVLIVDRAGKKVGISGPLAPDFEVAQQRHRTTPRPPPHTVTKLTLDVPPDARVYLNGQRTRTTGSQRQYMTTALAVSQEYKNYPVRVEIDRNGRTMSREETIDLHAGQSREMVIYFDAPTERIARR